MAKAISQIGAANIAAVYSANDGMAGGVIKALKAAGVTSLPRSPVRTPTSTPCSGWWPASST